MAWYRTAYRSDGRRCEQHEQCGVGVQKDARKNTTQGIVRKRLTAVDALAVTRRGLAGSRWQLVGTGGCKFCYVRNLECGAEKNGTNSKLPLENLVQNSQILERSIMLAHETNKRRTSQVVDS